METIRWGFIGCGDVTEVKSGPAFQKIEGSTITAVMRRNGDKAKDYAQRHGIGRWYDDADRLIGDSEVDAVYVATPPGSHAEYTIRALEAGKPVYVEKPMAVNYDQCREMLAASERTGQPLFVAYYRRRLPAFLKVKELIDAGTIGSVRLVNLRLFWPPREGDTGPDASHWHIQPEISGGGHFFDLAPHQLDYLDYVFGPIASVGGQAANQAGWYEPEDIVTASFTFQSGVLGAGAWCFTVSEESSTDVIEIVGSEGDIRFPCFGSDPVVVTTASGREEYQFENPPHVHQPLVETVVRALRGDGSCPSTGESGARTAWVMDRIVEEWRGEQDKG